MSVLDQIYVPQMMIAGVRELMPVRTFLRDTFFKTTYTYTTPEVKLDFYTGVRRLAGFNKPKNEATTVERLGWTTKYTSPAYLKEKTTLTVDDTRTRAFGEIPYSPPSPQTRAAQILMDDLAMLMERFKRAEEKMCADAIVNGKVTVLGGGFDAEVDFGYVEGVNTAQLTGGACWDTDTGDPIKNIDDWRLDIQRRTGLTPTHCILGRDAAWVLARNPIVKAMLTNTINQQWGMIRPVDEGDGVSTYGLLTLPSGNVTFTSYNEWYRDPNSPASVPVDVPLIPNDVCIVACADARAEFHYGMIQNFYALPLGANPRFPYSWISEDGGGRMVQLESAPMPNLFQPNAFFVAHVLTP